MRAIKNPAERKTAILQSSCSHQDVGWAGCAHGGPPASPSWECSPGGASPPSGLPAPGCCSPGGASPSSLPAPGWCSSGGVFPSGLPEPDYWLPAWGD
ncbi:MAG: hypothetical protein KAS36_01340 [Anaerolineales bacterium]|nr:hypothetical protein [Anaerolineales bacterium]